MKYREAKKLIPGDIIHLKNDIGKLTVVNVEVFGQYKRCKINYTEESSTTIHSVFNEEVE